MTFVDTFCRFILRFNCCLLILIILVSLYWFCSLFIKNFLCTKTFSVVSRSLTLLKKWFTQRNILSVSNEVNLFNNVSIGFRKLLLAIMGCSGQFLQSPNHSGPSHQNSQVYHLSQTILWDQTSFSELPVSFFPQSPSHQHTFISDFPY